MSDTPVILAPKVSRAPRWWLVLAAAAALFGVSTATITIVQQGQALAAAQQLQLQQGTTIDNLAAALDESRDQLHDAGLDPVVPPSSVYVEGPAGPQGPGPTDDQVAAAVRAYCALHGGCVGQTGESSTVAGPSGPAGADGRDGADGATGSPGADGEPPVSWTFTWLATTYTCTRTDPFDATAPTYSCTTQ